MLFLASLFIAWNAHALNLAEVNGMAFGEVQPRVEALNKAADAADDTTIAFIQALVDDAVKTSGERVLVVRHGRAQDPVTGAEQVLPANADDLINPNFFRSEVDNVLAALKLFSKDEKTRRAAIQTLSGDNDESRLPLIEKAYALETVLALKAQLATLRAAIFLGSSDKAKRLQAAGLVGSSANPSTKTALLGRITEEKDVDVTVALQAALAKVKASLAWGASCC